MNHFLETTLLSIKFWITLSILEFLLILFLAKRKRLEKKDRLEEELLKKSKDAKIDMGNMVNSIFKSKELYNILIRKCHPDRFPTDPNLTEVATKLTQSIRENEGNYEKLVELKKAAQETLFVHFD